MDDCNLDKLGIKPGKLSPVFNKDTTDYNVSLASNVDKITFDCLTSDTGASYSISVGIPAFSRHYMKAYLVAMND